MREETQKQSEEILVLQLLGTQVASIAISTALEAAVLRFAREAAVLLEDTRSMVAALLSSKLHSQLKAENARLDAAEESLATAETATESVARKEWDFSQETTASKAESDRIQTENARLGQQGEACRLLQAQRKLADCEYALKISSRREQEALDSAVLMGRGRD